MCGESQLVASSSGRQGQFRRIEGHSENPQRPGSVLLQGLRSDLRCEQGMQKRPLLSGRAWTYPVVLPIRNMVPYAGGKSTRLYQSLTVFPGTPKLPPEQWRVFMPKGKPAAGELIRWLQTLDPHRSPIGDHDWLDEDEHGFWWSQEWQSGILIPWT